MAKFVSALIVSCFFLSLSALGSRQQVLGVVEKISDGDTVWVEADDSIDDLERLQNRLKIRMVEMDAPETHLPSSSGIVGQGHWGERATEMLLNMIPTGTSVKVEDYGLDKYERTLGTLLYKGADVNLAMVRSGWAVTYIICEGKTCTPSFFTNRHVKDYVKACEYAQKNGLGIWNPNDRLKEMPFEFRVRMQGREFEKYVGNFSTKELFEPTDYLEVPECQRIFFTSVAAARRLGYEFGNRYNLPNLFLQRP